MNEQKMLLEDALKILSEIATGDREQIAYKEVEHAVGAYRSLYEGAMKRMERFRDLAAKPDIFVPTYNKDRFSELDAAKREYLIYETEVENDGFDPKTFECWLFDHVNKPGSSK